MTSYMGEKAKPQVAVKKVVRSPRSILLLQTKQPQLPQLFPVTPVLQTPNQIYCPSLDMLQGLNVFLVVRDSKLNTVLEVHPHQS